MKNGRPAHRGDDFSRRHPRMAAAKRAKLFMPFDALTGLGETVAERRIVTVPEAELSEDALEELDRTLTEASELMRSGRPVLMTVTYFIRRDTPAGPALMRSGCCDGEIRGVYVKVTGMLTAVDMTQCCIQLVGRKIPLGDVYDLSFTTPDAGGPQEP